MESRYKIGATLRVKSWNRMKEEYGLTSTGSIHCPFAFTDEMRKFCGKKVQVRNIDNDEAANTYRYILTCNEVYGIHLYAWSEEMLEPVQPDWDE